MRPDIGYSGSNGSSVVAFILLSSSRMIGTMGLSSISSSISSCTFLPSPFPAFSNNRILQERGQRYNNVPSFVLNALNDDDTNSNPTTTTTATIASTNNIPLPEMYPLLASSLNDLGFITPTPIQYASALTTIEGGSSSSRSKKKDGNDDSIDIDNEPNVYDNNRMLAAPTGSGKTLAYLLPALSRILSDYVNNNDDNDNNGPKKGGKNTILVVAPTRELAVQLAGDASSLLDNILREKEENEDDNNNHNDNSLPTVALAVRGLLPPSPRILKHASVLVGTPAELLQVVSSDAAGTAFTREGMDFVGGGTLDTIILDEVDVLLPQESKALRTSFDESKVKKGGNRNNKGGDDNGGDDNGSEEDDGPSSQQHGKNNRKGGGGRSRGGRRSTPRTVNDGIDGKVSKTSNWQDDRRKLELRRKQNAALRKGSGINMGPSVSFAEVSDTERLLEAIASRRFSEGRVGTNLGTANADVITTPVRITAGSATASRRVLDRLNKVLNDSADKGAATSDVSIVWGGEVTMCRPIEEEEEDDKVRMDKSNQVDKANLEVEQGGTAFFEEMEVKKKMTRPVTVPDEVSHRYVTMPSRMEAASPTHILDAVSKVADQLLLKKEEGGVGGRGLVFLCGEFGKSNIAAPKKKIASKKGGTSKSRRDSMRKKNAKFGGSGGTAGTTSSGGGSGTASANALSARAACTILNEKGIRAEPLHVALGLEGGDGDGDASVIDSDEPSPLLVTFEGSARGLHLDGIDAVFLVGRPSSAASYLHLAGRVGRAMPNSGDDNDSVKVRPGTVVSFCTAGQFKELGKWTKQVGGGGLEEIVL